MTAPAARATDCAMLPGLPMLPLVADVALGRRALPSALRSFNALLRLDPVLVLRLLRVASRLPELPMDGPGARLDAAIDACGRPLLQAALLDADERVRSGTLGGAGHQSFWIHSLFSAKSRANWRCAPAAPTRMIWRWPACCSTSHFRCRQ